MARAPDGHWWLAPASAEILKGPLKGRAQGRRASGRLIASPPPGPCPSALSPPRPSSAWPARPRPPPSTPPTRRAPLGHLPPGFPSEAGPSRGRATRRPCKSRERSCSGPGGRRRPFRGRSGEESEEGRSGRRRRGQDLKELRRSSKRESGNIRRTPSQ